MPESYELQLFYDPRIIGMKLLHRFYKVSELECPPEDKLRTPLHTEEGLELAVTTFKPLTKDQAIGLAGVVLDYPTTRVEISHSKLICLRPPQ